MKDEKNCDHCYCKRVTENSVVSGRGEHKQCCNCGNKQKISDMEMNVKIF